MKTPVTPLQRVHVGKHRVMDDLSEIGNATAFYGMLADHKREKLLKLAALLALPDDDEATTTALTDAGYMDGREHLFYHEPAKSRPPETIGTIKRRRR